MDADEDARGGAYPPELGALFTGNAAWAARVRAEDPAFFARLERQQSPDYLWIGCSDSRVPSTQIVDLPPGAVFVHRNVANVVALTDLNCLSVLQFAIEALGVAHIIVCGHYACGGIRAAARGHRLGPIDMWLDHVRAVRDLHREWLAAIGEREQRDDLLCELNVIEQVSNLCRCPLVEDAWRRDQALTVHGCIYRLTDGRLRWLGISVAGEREIDGARAAALDALKR